MHKILKKDIGLEIWHIEDDKDVVLISQEEMRFTNKKRILEHYLKKVTDNLIFSELKEEKKNKLKSFYKLALAKAKILASKKGEISNITFPDQVTLDNEKYFEKDNKKNFYASDDI
ncbi:MAG: hypothetical protein JSV30_00190 [Candidatus Omnitrophota bacterium]|nr:MAG: hypothetical protein JSV30_00190 [Candidatus Omnitrophota bacterium]